MSFLWVTASLSGPRVCLRKASKIEMMMLVSRHSRKTMKKTEERVNDAHSGKVFRLNVEDSAGAHSPGRANTSGIAIVGQVGRPRHLAGSTSRSDCTQDLLNVCLWTLILRLFANKKKGKKAQLWRSIISRVWWRIRLLLSDSEQEIPVYR